MSETLKEFAKRLQLQIVEGPPPQSNFHRNRIAKGGPPLKYALGAIHRLPRPVSEAAVARVAFELTQVCSWAKTHGWTVRALGSGWSFSDVIAPGRTLDDGKCILVDTSAFKVFFQSKSNAELWYVTAGANLHNLNKAFEKRGLSIKTSGSSDGQTIAGAIGTGVHGSAYRFGALHDSVRAFHVATPQGHLLVCRSEASFGAAQQKEFRERFNIPRVEVDERLFDALCVSFGSFGVVVGVVVEVDPKYALRVIRRSFPASKMGALLEVLRTDGDLAKLDPAFAPERPIDRPHHCQILLNPYDRKNYKIVVMHERTGFTPPEPFEWPEVFDATGLAAINFLWDLVGHFDAAFAPLVSSRFNALSDLDAWGLRSDVFGTPEQPLPVHSFGVGVPLERTEQLLDLAHTAVQTEKFPGAGELRFVKVSPAHLAINRFAPVTAVLGFDGLDQDDSWEFSRLFLASVRKAKIPFAFHWGKMNDFGDDPAKNVAALNAAYGDSLTEWREARTKLLGDDAVVFDNAFVRRLGLV